MTFISVQPMPCAPVPIPKTAPTLTDLRARVDAVKKAGMLQKPALAEQTLEDFLKYLAAQDARIVELERIVHHG